MRKLALLISGLLAAIAAADTLDLSGWAVRMTVYEKSDSAPVALPELGMRGLNLLRYACYDDVQTVADYLMLNPKTSRKVDRLHLQPTRAGSKYLSDGTIATEYELPLLGALLQTIMPRTGGGIPVGPMACPCCGQPWPERREVPPGVTLIPLETGDAPAYSGVLIDARGLDLSPALFPRVVNEDGRVVYGPEFFLPNYAAERGPVAYYDNLSAAQADDRVGFDPLRITAMRVSGRNSSNPVISNSDARKLHGSVENLKLLERCRVVIITD
jgi:hypothetical protein